MLQLCIHARERTERRHMFLNGQWDLGQEAARDIAAALNVLLADSFTLLLKTKGRRWRASGPRFQGHQLLLHALELEINAAIDDIADRLGRIGATAVSSIA